MKLSLICMMVAAVFSAYAGDREVWVSAMTRVARPVVENLAAGTLDAEGWLTVGFNGTQPSLAEGYISRGSPYLACFVFLPLGLPPDHPFWTAPAADWTQKAAWSGAPARIDHALRR